MLISSWCTQYIVHKIDSAMNMALVVPYKCWIMSHRFGESMVGRYMFVLCSILQCHMNSFVAKTNVKCSLGFSSFFTTKFNIKMLIIVTRERGMWLWSLLQTPWEHVGGETNFVDLYLQETSHVTCAIEGTHPDILSRFHHLSVDPSDTAISI